MTVGAALDASDARNQVDASVRLAEEAAAAGLRTWALLGALAR